MNLSGHGDQREAQQSAFGKYTLAFGWKNESIDGLV